MIPNYYQWNYTKTHRCKGSVENRMSLYYMVSWYVDPINAWMLASHEYDYEYDCPHHRLVCKVTHCPWCGEELNEAD